MKKRRQQNQEDRDDNYESFSESLYDDVLANNDTNEVQYSHQRKASNYQNPLDKYSDDLEEDDANVEYLDVNTPKDELKINLKEMSQPTFE